jgi:hypothetical protein
MSRWPPVVVALAVLIPACVSTPKPGGREPLGGGRAMPPPPSTTPASPPPSTSASFEERVRPVLARRCTPCHEPGGVMYGRMPFDQPETILAHREGVLKRMKNDDERAAIEAWLLASG